MFIARKRRTLSRSSAAVLMASAALVLSGCGDSAGPEAGTDVGDGGVYDDFSRIQSFEGQQVTTRADAVQIVAPNAFTIAHQSGKQLLVVHREPAPNVAVSTPVQVTGTAKKAFDIAAAEQFAGVDFNDAEFVFYNGEPYIQASNIDTNAPKS